jgi:hypothetical protein
VCDRAAQEGSADEAEARIQRGAIAPQVDHQRESVRSSLAWELPNSHRTLQLLSLTLYVKMV